MSFLDYLDLIHPRIEVGTDTLSFHKYKRFDIPYTSIKKIKIYISSFIDPHLLVGIDHIERDNILVITLGVKREPPADRVHEDLMLKLKAWSDPNRMK